jgi:hypothetical protein
MQHDSKLSEKITREGIKEDKIGKLNFLVELGQFNKEWLYRTNASQHQRKWVSIVSNHQARLTYDLRTIIVLIWADTILTVTTWLVISKAH